MNLVNAHYNMKLYSRIGQADSYLNAKIAAAAGRDSTAMKTLALLGTLFLPPTFVAVCAHPHNAVSRLF